jgi:hypothetical protein
MLVSVIWLLAKPFIDQTPVRPLSNKPYVRSGAFMAFLEGSALLWEVTMIKKVEGGYKVLSEKGKKNLGGPYKTKKEAEKRLQQVEYFKHKKG